MADIKDLLNKFKKIVQDKNLEKTIIIKILKEKIGDDIDDNKITLKKEKLFIKSNSYIKTEINLKKEEILKEFRKSGIENIKDIK
jgi:hypothetical protein